MDNSVYISNKEKQEWDKFFDEWRADMMFGTVKKRVPAEDENVKLAYVVIDGKRQMLGVDNKTLKGYELNEDIPTWKLPLIEKHYDSFERWCTSFDV